MRLKLVAALFAVIGYFSLAYYFKVSYVDDVPRRDDVAKIMRILPTATPGTFVAHLWLPTHATQATVYEDGISIGAANRVYDDPGRGWVFDGRRWKFVEFNSKGGPALRWIIFSEARRSHP